jgi:hypothetical protein
MLSSTYKVAILLCPVMCFFPIERFKDGCSQVSDKNGYFKTPKALLHTIPAMNGICC